MNEKVIDEVSSAWIVYQREQIKAESNSQLSVEQERVWPLYSKLLDWSKSDPEATWACIVAIWNRIDHENLDIIAVLGAGELEELLCNFGDDYFPLIEKFCEVEPDFKTVLRMVWQSSMSQELWQKVQDLRGGPNL